MVINANSKLADYIKHDTALGRDQNINMGKEGFIDNNKIKALGGVTITEFAPTREAVLKDTLSKDEKSARKFSNFEEKMEYRKQHEVEKQSTMTITGGRYIKPNCMSIDNYKKINP